MLLIHCLLRRSLVGSNLLVRHLCRDVYLGNLWHKGPTFSFAFCQEPRGHPLAVCHGVAFVMAQHLAHGNFRTSGNMHSIGHLKNRNV